MKNSETINNDHNAIYSLYPTTVNIILVHFFGLWTRLVYYAEFIPIFQKEKKDLHT